MYHLAGIEVLKYWKITWWYFQSAKCEHDRIRYVIGLHRLHPRLLQLWLQSPRTHRETMKCDNSFPMAINYRINSARHVRAFAKLPFLRNQLFCFVAKPIAFRSNRIFFRGIREEGGGRDGRDARDITLNDQFFRHARAFVVHIKCDKSRRRIVRSAGLLMRYFIGPVIQRIRFAESCKNLAHLVPEFSPKRSISSTFRLKSISARAKEWLDQINSIRSSDASIGLIKKSRINSTLAIKCKMHDWNKREKFAKSNIR